MIKSRLSYVSGTRALLNFKELSLNLLYLSIKLQIFIELELTNSRLQAIIFRYSKIKSYLHKGKFYYNKLYMLKCKYTNCY